VPDARLAREDTKQTFLVVRSANAVAEAIQDAERGHVTLTFLIGSIIAACALIAGAFLLARAYRRAALSEGVLQATLDSVREGVAAFDADRRLLAWNQIFSRMLKLPRGTLRRGKPLPAGMTNEVDHFSEYLETLDTEVKRTGRAALMERKETGGRSLEIFHSPDKDGGSVTTFLDSSGKPRRRCARHKSSRRSAK